MTASFLVKWSPIKERSTIGCFVFSSESIGYIVAEIVIFIFVKKWYFWQGPLIIWPIMVIGWSILFVKCFSYNPSDDIYLTEKEKKKLFRDIGTY